MPELPEVETTVRHLKDTIKRHRITDSWSGYSSVFHKGKENIKNRAYFRKRFAPSVVGASVTDVSRVGKNILIHLSNDWSILVHMKMTGHLLYGAYRKAGGNSKHQIPSTKQIPNPKYTPPPAWQKEEWLPEADEESELWNSFNRHIRFLLFFENGKALALSDARKFGKVTLVGNRLSPSLRGSPSDPSPTGGGAELHPDLKNIGPDALDVKFADFKQRVSRKANLPIKQVLTMQEVVAGIGNIYADETLWLAGVHPERKVKTLKDSEYKMIFKSLKQALRRGIKSGGDSTSDYRRPDGSRGGHQKMHNAYRMAGTRCKRRGCTGTIRRTTLAARGTYFCPECQKQNLS